MSIGNDSEVAVVQTQANKVAVYELKDLPQDRVRASYIFLLHSSQLTVPTVLTHPLRCLQAVYVKEGSLFFRSSKKDALERLEGRNALTTTFNLHQICHLHGNDVSTLHTCPRA